MAQAAKKIKLGSEGITWDLTDLYKGLDDPRIDKDRKSLLKRSENYEKTFRGKINAKGLSAKKLSLAVKELESISEKTGRLLSFAYLVFAADTSKPEHGAFLQSVQEWATGLRKHLIFFELEWMSVPEKKAKEIMKSPEISEYKHFLELERRYKPHRLTEPEEKIMDEKANTGSRAFKRLFDEVLNNIEFKVKIGKKTHTMSETETLALLYDPNREKRKAAAKGLTEGLLENSHVLTYIFNTLVYDHAANDRLRSFEYPMESRHLDNEIKRETVQSLISSCVDNYDMVESYHKLKKKLLGVGKLYDYDRYAPIFPDTKIIKYDTARGIIIDSFAEFSPRMSSVADMFFEKNWIDAETRAGKRGGAFSHGTVPSAHPYVFINYTGRMRDVMTLAHELGHGVHQYLSRKQGYFEADTPLTTAETASVFAEMLVFHKLMESETDNRVKLALICGKLEDIFATVFRQVVLTNFEESLHVARRGEGELTKDRIGELWIEANQPMYGNSVTLTKDYANWWMYIPHFIHSPFYCYAYSFGELLVLALFNKYQNEGDRFVPRYIELLSSGGSDSPNKLLKRVGVNINDPGFWQGGLDLLRDMVEEGFELAKKS